jgi:hypothetical protein
MMKWEVGVLNIALDGLVRATMHVTHSAIPQDCASNGPFRLEVMIEVIEVNYITKKHKGTNATQTLHHML